MLFDQLFEDSTPYPETRKYAQQVAQSMHERGYRDGELSDGEFISVVADTLRHLTRDADTRVWMMNHDKEFFPLIKKYLQHLAGQGIEEARHFRTAYGWAGGYNEKTGKKYKHPEQIKADREAKKQQKPQEKQPEIKEGVNAKQIKKDLDSGMSYDAVIGKHANKRLTNTDEIRRVIQQHAWEKRMKQPKEKGVAEGSHSIEVGDKITWYQNKFYPHRRGIVRKVIGNTIVVQHPESGEMHRLSKEDIRTNEKQGVAEGLPAHIKKSDVPPAMRPRLTMKDVEAERPQGAYRYRVGDKEFMDLAAAQSFARGTGETVKPIREVKKKLGERGVERSARIERILKMLRARNPQAQDDLEALLLNYRADQAHDEQEINRLDAENDQEEADIDALQRIVKQRMNENLWSSAESAALAKLHTKNHPAFSTFAESWYRAHGGI